MKNNNDQMYDAYLVCVHQSVFLVQQAQCAVRFHLAYHVVHQL